MTTEPEPASVEAGPDDVPLSVEEQLRRRASMLIQLLAVAVITMVLQGGIMLKMLLEK
jgi:hypothetical protein